MKSISQKTDLQAVDATFNGLPTPVTVLFLALAAFSFVAQMPLPGVVRPLFLTLGAGGLATAALAVSLWYGARSIFILVAIVTIVLFWTFAFPAAINGNDDNAAYLIFAKSFYNDLSATIQPLSERRLFAVGGIYAFQAPVMHWLGINYLSLVEPVFGLLLFAVVVLSVRSVPLVWVLLVLGVLALSPAIGSNGLANTASAFVLGAFTLALLSIALGIFLNRRAAWGDLALLVSLPLVAMIFRPTTAPFNVCISASVSLYAIFMVDRAFARLIVLSIAIFVIFIGSLISYYNVGETYLYPLFGRGTHITSEGYSIADTLTTLDHARNIALVPVRDPVFIIVVFLMCFCLFATKRSTVGIALGAIFCIYLCFVVLMVVATGGTASMRYVFPVSLALMIFVLTILGSRISVALPYVERLSQASVASVLIVGLVLTLIALRSAASGVVEQRLAQYNLHPAARAELEEVARIANTATAPGEATLLISVAPARFLVPNLDGRFLIMDQAGMLSPWRPEITDYQLGLINYLKEQHISAIVTPTLSCPFTQRTNMVGWGGMSELAMARNQEALCSLQNKWQRIDTEKYTILTQEDPTELKRKP